MSNKLIEVVITGIVPSKVATRVMLLMRDVIHNHDGEIFTSYLKMHINGEENRDES